MGLSIDIAANTRAAQRDVKDLSKSVDDTADALDDLARNGDKAGDKVEASFRNMARESDRAGNKVEDAFRDMVRAAGRADDAVSKIGDTSKRSFDKAADGAQDFKQEAEQTAKETAASFDGSGESIVDMFQEVAANALSAFGPAGVIAGLAAAGGIGLAVAGFQAVGEEEQASRERASGWAQAYTDAGSKVLSAAITTATAMKIAADPKQFAEATENAKNWGVDVSVAINAMAGETWALNAANDALAAKQEQVSTATSKAGGDIRGLNHEMRTMREEASTGATALDQLKGDMAAGAEQADALSRSLANTAEHTEGAITTIDEFGDRVTNLPDGTTIYVDAETGQATTDLDLIEKKVYGMPSDKELTIRARSVLEQAQRDIDGFMVRNGGKEIRIKTRVVTSGGDWDR